MKLTDELMIKGIQENISMSAGSQSPGLNHITVKFTVPLIILQTTKIVETESKTLVRDTKSSSSRVGRPEANAFRCC